MNNLFVRTIGALILTIAVGYAAQREYKESDLIFQTDQPVVERKTGKLANGHVKQYDKQGYVWAEQTYKNGQFDGLRKLYYSSGEIQTEVNFKNGKFHGVFKNYFRSGRLENEASFKHGKLDLYRKCYYESGLLESKETYDNSVVTYSESYYSNGTKECEASYKNGKLDGMVSWWGSNGLINQKSSYREGVLDGTSTDWIPDSLSVFHVVQFDNGRAVEGYIDPTNSHGWSKRMSQGELMTMLNTFTSPCNKGIK